MPKRVEVNSRPTVNETEYEEKAVNAIRPFSRGVKRKAYSGFFPFFNLKQRLLEQKIVSSGISMHAETMPMRELK